MIVGGGGVAALFALTLLMYVYESRAQRIYSSYVPHLIKEISPPSVDCGDASPCSVFWGGI